MRAEFDGLAVETDQPVGLGRRRHGGRPVPPVSLPRSAPCAGFFALRFMRQRGIDAEGSATDALVPRTTDTPGLVASVLVDLELPPGFPDKYRERSCAPWTSARSNGSSSIRRRSRPPLTVCVRLYPASPAGPLAVMSRAFVKEDDEAPDAPLPERPVSDHPNYVTPSGLAQLEARREELEAERLELARRADADDSARERLRYVERDLRYFGAGSRRPLTIDVETRRPDVVGFGATVGVREGSGEERSYTIVGEDEADPDAGLVSWVSPLANVLEGARVGEHVLWRRPAGPIDLTVVSIRYEAHGPRAREGGLGHAGTGVSVGRLCAVGARLRRHAAADAPR